MARRAAFRTAEDMKWSTCVSGSPEEDRTGQPIVSRPAIVAHELADIRQVTFPRRNYIKADMAVTKLREDAKRDLG